MYIEVNYTLRKRIGELRNCIFYFLFYKQSILRKEKGTMFNAYLYPEGSLRNHIRTNTIFPWIFRIAFKSKVCVQSSITKFIVPSNTRSMIYLISMKVISLLHHLYSILIKCYNFVLNFFEIQ